MPHGASSENFWKFCKPFLSNETNNYDCVNHDLIIAKLEAYRVGQNSLRLIQNYLSQRQQRVEVGSSFSEWLEIILGTPQGSILGPILFNVFVTCFFSLKKQISVTLQTIQLYMLVEKS